MLLPLFEVISQSYYHYESDRILIERTMEISSKELTDSNRQLLEESKRQKVLIESLKESISAISPDDIQVIDEDILQIAEILKAQVEKRRIAEEQIAISEEKYRGIIENMELGMLEMDPEGVITNASQEFCKMVGRDRLDLISKHGKELLVSSEHHHIIKEQEELRRKGEYGVFELPLLHASGETRWMVVSSAPVFDPKGSVVGSVAMHFDISYRKNIESALEKAKVQAEESLKSKELFLANISHEIRTPMNAILGMSRLLNDSALNETQMQCLQAIQTSSEGLLVIINDLLDMSKITSGKFTIENIDFQLDKVINSMEKSLEFKAVEKGIYLKIERDPEIEDYLKGDPTRITQILTNLVSNAIKFTKSGGVTIKLILKEKHATKDVIQFKVEDTGLGIDEKNIQKIFDSFTQEDES
ncbi:MAG: PAS domain S-box protein, partial [Flavobacteriales bacterium]|nr:PAS domain S-box protein [Flavobacteriales bacterium]